MLRGVSDPLAARALSAWSMEKSTSRRVSEDSPRSWNSDGERRLPGAVVELLRGLASLKIAVVIGVRTGSEVDHIVPRLIAAGRGSGIDAVTSHHLAHKPQTVVVARVRDTGEQVVEAALQQIRRARRSAEPGDVAIGYAGAFRKARAVEPEIEDRIFVAALEPGANLGIAARYPPRPRGLQLGGRLALQLGGQVLRKRVNDGLGFIPGNVGFERRSEQESARDREGRQ